MVRWWEMMRNERDVWWSSDDKRYGAASHDSQLPKRIEMSGEVMIKEMVQRVMIDDMGDGASGHGY